MDYAESLESLEDEMPTSEKKLSSHKKSADLQHERVKVAPKKRRTPSPDEEESVEEPSPELAVDSDSEEEVVRKPAKKVKKTTSKKSTG